MSDKEETHYVSFIADINPKTSEILIALCGELIKKGAKTIYLLISTPGGRVAEGIALHNMLRGLPVKIITHNIASVDSIGNVIFLAGEERYSCPNATFMFHGVGFDVEKMRFEEKILKERLDSIKADQQRIAAIIEERSSIPPDEIKKLFFEAVTRDPDYAKSKGLINDIREVDIPDGAPFHQLVFKR